MGVLMRPWLSQARKTQNELDLGLIPALVATY